MFRLTTLLRLARPLADVLPVRHQGGSPSYCGQVGEERSCGKRAKNTRYCKKEAKHEVVEQKCRKKKGARPGGHPRP